MSSLRRRTERNIYPSRSDSIEEIMGALGFGWLKRRALRNFPSITDIDVSDASCNEEEPDELQMTWRTKSADSDEEYREVLMTTHFPYNNVKSGVIPLHGRNFEYKVHSITLILERMIFTVFRMQTREFGCPQLTTFKVDCCNDECQTTGASCTIRGSSLTTKMFVG